MRSTRKLTLAQVVAMAVLAPALVGPALAEKTWTPQQEEHAGKGALKGIMSGLKPWDSAEQLARCQKIVATLAPLSPRPPVRYQITLLDTGTEDQASPLGVANAVSLPGGYIIITRGLLDPTYGKEAAFFAAQSDDELAGVLAHEIAHNALYHALKQADRNQKYMRGELIAALVGLAVGGNAAGAFGALGMANFVRMGVLSEYSIEYEAAADAAAVDMMAHSPYGPAGLLTFMERLAADVAARPQPPLGIEQTHPYPIERVQMLRRAIAAKGIDVNRRAVTAWKRAEALEAVIHGQPASVLMLWDRTIFTFRTTSPTGETPAQRCQAACDCLNQALAQDMAEFDIRVEEGASGPVVTLMGKPLLTALPGDLDDVNQCGKEGCGAAAKALREALFCDTLSQQIRSKGD